LIKAQDPLGNDISGDVQVGTVEKTLKKPIVIRFVDNLGNPQPNIKVEFSILEEPKENIITNKFAKLSQEQVKTDHDGYAMTELTFGKSKGNYYILAEVQGERAYSCCWCKDARSSV
jgi:hypothetical protein